MAGSLVIIYITKPLICHYPQCYHCLFCLHCNKPSHLWSIPLPMVQTNFYLIQSKLNYLTVSFFHFIFIKTNKENNFHPHTCSLNVVSTFQNNTLIHRTDLKPLPLCNSNYCQLQTWWTCLLVIQGCIGSNQGKLFWYQFLREVQKG